MKHQLESPDQHKGNAPLKPRLDADFDFVSLVGESPAMQRTLELVRKVAHTTANVLITGEKGTGKELIARSIHALSRRRRRRFVPLDCAALAGLEVELFGAEQGAYTGAVNTRTGMIEYAGGGTLFLDEISCLPLTTQGTLLRVLKEHAVRRVGGIREIPLDVRVVSATNQDLDRLVHEGRLREDLYYRLAVLSVPVPPLRERPGDVSLLAQHFVAEFAPSGNVRGVSSTALTLLERHTWPGNLLELRNVIDHAVSVTESSLIMPADLPPYLLKPRTVRSPLGASFRALLPAAHLAGQDT